MQKVNVSHGMMDQAGEKARPTVRSSIKVVV
jgi:hypothetical protein